MDEAQTDLLSQRQGDAARHLVRELAARASDAARALTARKPDPEALHDFRTSLRRLRSLLRVLSPALGRGAPKWQRRLAKIADLTGQGRDAEVQLAWLQATAPKLSASQKKGADWLRKRLVRTRDEGYERARRDAVRQFRKWAGALTDWLDEVPSDAAQPFGAFYARALHGLADELANRLLAVESISDAAALHKARIRAKRLRYALEPVRALSPEAGEAVQRLRTLQDLLGELHDRLLLASELGAQRAAAKGKARADGLAALERIARREAGAHFAQLQHTFLDDQLPALLAIVDAAASRLERTPAAGPPKEIERKYLLRALPPEAHRGRVQELWQGWLPGKVLQERLRRVRDEKGERYLRTVKLGRGLTRVEVEEEAPRELFEKMWPLTEGRRVQKRRYQVPDGALTWEIDAFTDRELFLAEVELPTEDTASPPPEWLAPYVVREVTGEDDYVNVNLAR